MSCLCAIKFSPVVVVPRFSCEGLSLVCAFPTIQNYLLLEYSPYVSVRQWACDLVQMIVSLCLELLQTFVITGKHCRGVLDSKSMANHFMLKKFHFPLSSQFVCIFKNSTTKPFSQHTSTTTQDGRTTKICQGWFRF